MTQDSKSDDLVARLFYLATVRLETAAGLAADGQAPDAPATELAKRLLGTADEIQILADAIVALAKPGP